MNYIYGYRNKITNKWYVGQTSGLVNNRHRSHISTAQNPTSKDYNSLFHKKLREYGVDNFELIILEEVLLKEDLDSREIYWIKEKNSFIRNNGYNLTTGGQRRISSDSYNDIRMCFPGNEIFNVISKIKDMNYSLTEIADEYGVSLSLICTINSGKSYFNKELQYPLRPFIHNKISNEIINSIIEFLKENYSNIEISEILNIDTDIVYRINYGLSHIQKDLNYPIRKINKNIERANKIKKLLKENNLNNKQISLIVKCDPSVVSNINYGKAYRDENLTYPIR